MEPTVFQFLALPIFVGLAGAAGVALCRPVLAARLGALIAVICFIAYAAMARQVSVETSLVMPFWAIPSLNIAGGLRLDGLSLIFVLLITGIGALILLYASRYLESDPRLSRLVILLILFMVAMLGSVTADDVMTLFVFWELTSLTSFFLVGYDHQKSSARKAALQALLVTGGGGLALLAGLVLVSMLPSPFSWQHCSCCAK
jgi:multicomponent Na+:H+ antiporter subunit A